MPDRQRTPSEDAHQNPLGTQRASIRRPRRPRTETRKEILAVAQRLFYWHGIRSTGIDRIAAEAGVAPVTLYRSFATKDELVEAYVEYNAEGYRQWLLDATRPELGSAEQRLLAMFDALADQVRPENCRGCPFLMTLAEYPDRDHPAPARAIELKQWVRSHIRGLTAELARERSLRDPGALGDQLVLMFEGVYASVQALGADGPAGVARATAQALIVAAVAAE